MLAPQDYYKLNHRAMQAGGTVGLDSSNLLLQPGPDNAHQAAQAFLQLGLEKIPGIAQPLWTTARSLIACTVVFFSLYLV